MSTPENQDGPRRPRGADLPSIAARSARLTAAKLEAMIAIESGEHPDTADRCLEDLGLDLGGSDPLEEQATRLIDKAPLAILTTITFEIVLESGAVDRRLVLECDVDLLEVSEFGRLPDADGFDIRRVLYRYRACGSSEVELGGPDREAAETFARRVVLELAMSR